MSRIQNMDVMIATARLVSRLAHGDQLDKSGQPFYLHPAYVAQHVTSPMEKVVGFLHDVVEDTNVTQAELRPVFGDEVVDTILLLTHDPKVPYMDYIRNLSSNPVARHVKMADLTHNMDESRFGNLPIPEHLVWKRRTCYIPAYEYLVDVDKQEMAGEKQYWDNVERRLGLGAEELLNR